MPSAPPAEFAAAISDSPLDQEMRDSFVPYSLAVMRQRAIPDARDGLKPVQRRILYAMSLMGLKATAGHRKSATIVGEVMGNFHPHGDSAVYGAMVRMGQPFAAKVPLVDPRGNFGGLDDPPAAYRYTEARLSAAAETVLDGINEDAVDFFPTFDGERHEPVVLPALIPNLLANGAEGIAVGISTSIPPHNLAETAAAVRMWIKASGAGRRTSLERLMKALPGPDFPCGGIVDGDIAGAYRTGKGTLRLRARCEIQKVARSRRRQLVFTELPWMVSPVAVVNAVRAAKEANKVTGVVEASDTSSSDGPQVTVSLAGNADPEAVIEALYAATPLGNRVAVNMVAVVGGSPRQLSLRELIEIYADHLTSVTKRRALFALKAARARAHVLRGLIAAADRIRDVVTVITEAEDTAAAREELMRLLGIDEEQADAVLEMRLRQLSNLETTDLRDRLAVQESIIGDRSEVVNDEKRLRDEAIKAMDAAVEASAAAPRQTTIATEE